MTIASRFCLRCLSGCAILFLLSSNALAQEDAIENELKQLSGNWRVIELVEDGRAVTEEQMKYVLPGGGILEIVDMTILFKSPMDGRKETRSFRIDPTSYPKKIAIFQLDTTTGAGIYKFDQGKWVVCFSRNTSQQVNEFSAATGSHQTLMVLERFEDGENRQVPGYNVNLPAPPPRQAASNMVPVTSKPTAPTEVAPPVTTTASSTSVIQPPVSSSAPATNSLVGKPVLTDTDVHNLALGKWRINDQEGSIDIIFGANGKFQTYRYFQSVQNFQTVFVPTPISSGEWSVANGRLLAKVTSSTRANQINHVFAPSVRSISPGDMILVDHFGRVTRAVKVP